MVNKKINKCIASFILSTIIVMCAGNSAHATDITGNGGVSGVVPVTGTVSAVIITVAVPTVITFAINPNNPTPCTSTPATFSNNSTVGVSIDFLGFKAKTDTPTLVVDNALFPDWNKLGSADTESKIALGIVDEANTFWSPGGINAFDNATVAAGTFSIAAKTTVATDKSISIVAKSGNSWSKAYTIAYEMGIRIKLL